MKVGDTFVHKEAGGEWRVLEVARANDDGTEMYRVTCCVADDRGVWFSADGIKKNYRVV